MTSALNQSPVLLESSLSSPHLPTSPDLDGSSLLPPVSALASPEMSQAQPAPASTGEQHDESSSSDSGSSDGSTETARTASTPRSDPVPAPEQTSSSEATPNPDLSVTNNTEETSGGQRTEESRDITQEGAETANTDLGQQAQQNEVSPPADHPPEETIPPPPPPPIEIVPPRSRDDVPEWAKHEDDTSTPDEQEMKEIQARTEELNATNIPAVEKIVFSNIDDPEMRPVKKIRMSWVIKGVRGNRSKPNRARIITSPAFFSDGVYWNIKFFPRGNKSRNSLAAFVRCSKTPLSDIDQNQLEGSFVCFEGDAADEELQEKLRMTITPPVKAEKTKPKEAEEAITSGSDAPVADDVEITASTEVGSTVSPDTQSPASEQTPAVQSQEQPIVEAEPRIQEAGDHGRENDDDDDSSSSSDDEDIESPFNDAKLEKDDFRVSAQLGMVVYNPDEPRTCYTVSSEHQFCPHEDDWGWDSLVSRWDDIHRRKRGQRQALLRNDTLALDAYIRIYEDPTKALFWHSSSTEPQWDSKLLAGYFPMGTRLLYHSPAVAGITAWSLLAPFRSLIQETPAGEWRQESTAKPRPLLANLQLMLFQMRHMRKDESYIHLDNVICEIMAPGESFEDVKTFWEVFRRSLELELEGDEKAVARLAEIFGTSSGPTIPPLPVKNIKDIQQGLNQAFETAKVGGKLPDFLPLMLDRQSFDKTSREWRLHHDRVHLNEEIDVSQWANASDSIYTLYGFVVHDGERNSGKFYSILRPEGPGGKWLAFSDGNGNKVFSYTRKSLAEYEGLDGAELKGFNSTRQTAYMAMYIRKQVLQAYLPGPLEPYKLPGWLVPHIEEAHNGLTEVYDQSEELEQHEKIKVEVFWDESIIGHEGTINMYNMKTGPKSQMSSFRQSFTADSDATFKQVRQKIASTLELDEAAVYLWNFNYHKLALYSKVYMHIPDSRTTLGKIVEPGQVLCLWFATFADHQRPDTEKLQPHFEKLKDIHVEKPPVLEKDMNVDKAAEDLSAVGDQPERSEAAGVDASEPLREEPSPTDAAENPTMERETANPEITGENSAAPDLEQDSVQQAVATTIENATQTPLNPAPDAVTPTPEAQDQTLSITSANPQAGAQPNLVVSENTGNAEDSPAIEANEMVTAEVESVEEAEPAVFHGHLFDAATHEEVAVQEQEPIVVDLTVPTVTDFQTAAIEASLAQIPGDISAEDAALIASMMAADLAAAERDNEARNADRDDASSRSHDDDSESRPSTPGSNDNNVYGFLQIFSVDQQTIVTRLPFLAKYDSLVSDMVRHHLSYEKDQQFVVWRREGPYDTTVIPSDATFQNQVLQDGCDIIVGDVVSESKSEELKRKGDFCDPGHLIKYIIMTRHRHPILSQSTTSPIELADFGGDYFKGNLVRGRRHGPECTIITTNGEVYEGPMLADQKAGPNGKMTYHNGDLYTGDWLDDLRHGQGEFIEKRTGNRYVGGYEQDKRWGKGVTHWEQADEQADLCQICYFEDIDALFYECGHVCACYACAKECPCCPICRKTVRAVVRMYRS